MGIINTYLTLYGRNKEELERKESQVIKLLEKTNQTIGGIFNVQNIINLMVCYNINIEIIKM